MKKTGRRKGILGGTFDPPHIGHLIIAENARDQFDLSEILWIPAQTPPHKRSVRISPAADRAEMTRRMVDGDRAFTFSDIELRREKISYTLHTVIELEAAEPGTQFFLIIGGDCLCEFHTWHRYEEILDRVPLLVYDRPDYSTHIVHRDILACVEFINSPGMNISSTEIRKRVRDGRSIRYLVTETVRRYIEQNRLYRQA